MVAQRSNNFREKKHWQNYFLLYWELENCGFKFGWLLITSIKLSLKYRRRKWVLKGCENATKIKRTFWTGSGKRFRRLWGQDHHSFLEFWVGATSMKTASLKSTFNSEISSKTGWKTLYRKSILETRSFWPALSKILLSRRKINTGIWTTEKM